MKSIATAFALALVLAATSASAQSFDDIEAAFQDGDSATADRLWEERVEADAATVDDYRLYARLLARGSRNNDALNVLLQGLERYPDANQFHMMVAFIHRRAERYDAAIDAYEEFLSNEPEDPDGLFGLAESYRLSGRTDDAIDLYGRYLEREDRESKEAQRALAEGHLAGLTGQVVDDAPAQDSAAPDTDEPEQVAATSTGSASPFRSTSEQAPTTSEPFVAPDIEIDAGASDLSAIDAAAMGDVAMSEARYDAAVEAYRQAVAAGDGVRDWYKLGVALAVSGDVETAVAAFHRVRDAEAGFPGIDDIIEQAEARAQRDRDLALDRPGYFTDDDVRAASRTDAIVDGNWLLEVRSRIGSTPLSNAEADAYVALLEGRPEEAAESAMQALGNTPGELVLYLLVADAYRLSGDATIARYFVDLYAELGGPEEDAEALVAAIERID